MGVARAVDSDREVQVSRFARPVTRRWQGRERQPFFGILQGSVVQGEGEMAQGEGEMVRGKGGAGWANGIWGGEGEEVKQNRDGKLGCRN